MKAPAHLMAEKPDPANSSAMAVTLKSATRSGVQLRWLPPAGRRSMRDIKLLRPPGGL